MYIPKISTKRVLGLVMASALAVSGVVAVAGSSEAAVAAVKVSPATGSTAAGTVIVITGKGFQNAAGVSKVGAVYFSLVTCAVANLAVNPASAISVVSDTKLSIVAPALALTATPKPTVWNLCIDDALDANVVGTAKYSSYLAPTINDQTAATKGVSVLTGASYGGGTIVILGENFTAKTTAKIGTLPILNAKVVIGAGTTASATGGDDTLTGTIPAGTGTGKTVSVNNEGGTKNALVATQLFNYVDAIKISPAFGDGTAGNVIAITGTGFLARTFQSTILTGINQSVIVLNKTLPLYAIGGAYALAQGAGGQYCTNIQVESDTSLSCKVPALAPGTVGGGYSVQIVDSLTSATLIQAITAVSRSAQYSVSAF